MTDTPDLRRQPCGDVLLGGITCTRPIGHGGTHWSKDLNNEAYWNRKPDPALPELLESTKDHVMTDEYPPCNCAATQDAHFFCHGDECQYKRAVVARYVAASGDSHGGAQPPSQFEDWVIEAARQILAEIALEKPRLRTSRIAEIIQAARGGAQPEPDWELLAANEITEEFFMNHAEKKFNSNEGRAEFIAGIIRKRVRAGSSPAPSPAKDGICYLCTKSTVSLHGNPSLWPAWLPFKNGNGRSRCYHLGCVADSLAALERMRAGGKS